VIPILRSIAWKEGAKGSGTSRRAARKPLRPTLPIALFLVAATIRPAGISDEVVRVHTGDEFSYDDTASKLAAGNEY
jgi:hypothetical protein